jgi:hypothetical protein
MREPRPLATLGAFTACNRDIFTLHKRLTGIWVRRKETRVLAYAELVYDTYQYSLVY